MLIQFSSQKKLYICLFFIYLYTLLNLYLQKYINLTKIMIFFIFIKFIINNNLFFLKEIYQKVKILDLMNYYYLESQKM